MIARSEARLGSGDKWSEKYPGLIECASGAYRKPLWWVNKKGERRPTNTYYKVVQCASCGAAVLSDKSNAKKGARHFCSPECWRKIRTTPDGHKIYKRGKMKGHIMVKSSDHPRRNRAVMVPEHRLVVEKHIGRYLRRDELIHHINCAKDDNRLSNLVICRGDSEHFLIHGSLNKCVATLMESGAILFDRAMNRYYVGVGW